MSQSDPQPQQAAPTTVSEAGRKQVDIMILGVQKAGTSTLLRYLGDHPQLKAQIPPEMTYFRDRSMQGELADYWARYYGNDDGSGRYVGKLAGLIYEPEGLQRLKDHNPAVQTVVSLRDPVRRAHSQFWYARLKGLEPLETFEEALDGDPARFDDARAAYRCRYLEAGLYAEPVERLFEMFGRDQVHVYILEEYRNRASETVTPLLRAVGLDPADLPELAPTHNSARSPRSFRLAQAARLRRGPVQLVKRALPHEVKQVIRRRLLKANEVPWSPTPLAPETERRLRFEEPNRRLESLLGRELLFGLAWTIESAGEEREKTGADPEGAAESPPGETHRLGRTIVSGTMWSATARIGMLLFGLVTQALLARLLAPGDFGRYSLLLSLAGSVALICQFGLPQSTLRAVAKANSEGRGLARGVIVRSARLALGSALVGGLLVLWPFGRIIAGFFPRADLQAVIGFFAILAAIRILENIAPELFRGIKDFRGSSLFGGLLAAVALAVFSAAYLQFGRSASLTDALILTIASAGLTLVLGAAVLGRKVRSMPANAEPVKITGLLNRSLWLGTIFNYSITQLDLWVVGAMGSPREVAVYAAAFRLSMLITIPLSIVNFVVPPLVVELLHKGDNERLGRTVQTVTTIAGGPALVGVLAFIAFGGAITQLIYGGFYAAAGLPLAILSVGKLSSVLSGPCGTTLIMAGGQRESLRILALNFVFTLPMQIAGMHLAGLPGLAAATTLGFIFQQVHLAIAVKRRIGVGTHFNVPRTYRLLRDISSDDLRSLFKVRP